MWRTVGAEWGKTWSVRAPWACLVATAALIMGTATSLANDFVHGIGTGEQPAGATMAVVDAVGPGTQCRQLARAPHVPRGEHAPPRGRLALRRRRGPGRSVGLGEWAGARGPPGRGWSVD